MAAGMMNAQVESMPIGAPNGSRKTRGSQEMMATAAPSLGPKASAAMRRRCPTGQYISHGAMGKMGKSCTRLRMSEAAVKSAAEGDLAGIDSVVHGKTFRFFHPDYTVGPGIAPGRPRFAARGLQCARQGVLPRIYRRWELHPRP